ncbi:hypothetical protein VE04_01057 [Pseudogymnoascus sp. 24MN13]|nr:hypothetical protein VE04_01056 [Pseudogymnoascus sp. 24MN13]OBT58064.1 hypothetical protein VE04_01057 [Pseudogymnoascus sp. 24MN13]
MPNRSFILNFLQPLPLYKTERPFLANVSPEVGFNPKIHTNIQVEQCQVDVTDIRPRISDFKLEKCGFQVTKHETVVSVFDTNESMERYRRESEQLLTKIFGAVKVRTWDSQLRINAPVEDGVFDMTDPLAWDKPARSVHNDYTWTSGPITMKERLTEEERAEYLRPGLRYRMINTWRTLVPNLQNSPLAMMDFCSLHPDDLEVSDRVRPNGSGELFHVYHNPKQKWYWLDSMMSDELLVFVTYDSKAGDHARICPHAAAEPIPGEEYLQSSPARRSIETRSIVITRC